MVVERAERAQLAPKWTPVGLLQRFRNVVHSPSEFVLALQMGYFLLRAPSEMEKANLPDFLARLRARRPHAHEEIGAQLERIVRLRSAWLRTRWFRRSNTCYIRALTLYRFLNAGHHAVAIRFGVERSREGRRRLRGHAWITVDDRILEGPDAVILGRVSEVPIIGGSLK